MQERGNSYSKKLRLNYDTYIEGNVPKEIYLKKKSELEKFDEKIKKDLALKKSELEKIKRAISSGKQLTGRLVRIGKLLEAKAVLDELSFEERKKLIKIMFEGFTFYFDSVTIDDAEKLDLTIPVFEYGMFFGKGVKTGVQIWCEGFWEEEAIIKRLEKQYISNIVSIKGHAHTQ